MLRRLPPGEPSSYRACSVPGSPVFCGSALGISAFSDVSGGSYTAYISTPAWCGLATAAVIYPRAQSLVIPITGHLGR